MENIDVIGDVHSSYRTLLDIQNHAIIKIIFYI